MDSKKAVESADKIVEFMNSFVEPAEFESCGDYVLLRYRGWLNIEAEVVIKLYYNDTMSFSYYTYDLESKTLKLKYTDLWFDQDKVLDRIREVPQMLTGYPLCALH